MNASQSIPSEQGGRLKSAARQQNSDPAGTARRHRPTSPNAASRQNSESRSTADYVLLFALTFQGLSGVAGGAGLVGDPTGASLGIPIEWLDGSPFANYLAPGLVLLSVLGVLPLVVVAGMWRRASWAPPASLAIGLMLLFWLAVEVAVIGYQAEPPFQAIYALIGAAIVALSFIPAIGAPNAPDDTRST